MKTQISKESHQPDKRYSGVYQQQGRMLTDADWGELMELVKQRLDDALHDVIDTGAPRGRGVHITKHGIGPLLINGTHLYADGVKAVVAPAPKADGSPGDTPFPYDGQADFPQAPALPLVAPGPAVPTLCIYGDLWERPVIALEDERLLDPALHGADTCTRTQTMAQIKWCYDDKDVYDPDVNPQKGNALVTVGLHAKLAEKDPCDPCADVVAPEARIGNYLFRVEIHDVKGPADAPNEVTLKWSSENGAEQHAVDAAPDDFSTGDWSWEFYDLTSEKHLGVHLVDSFSPRRGELVTDFPAQPAEDDTVKAYPFVRRWDGYVVLKRQADGTYALVTDANGKIKGKDKKATLSHSADPEDKTHGAVLPGDAFKVNLESLTLTVVLDGKTVVAGDYWLAVVREDIHNVGATVLEASEPLGIVHHYIELAKLNIGGALDEWEEGGPEWRKLNFPPLTDIHAGDVGYTTDCDSGLFNSEQHNTVKKALDQICRIGAEHVAFEKPCETSLYSDVSSEDIDTVAKALALLCDVRAKHVGFDRTCDTSIYKDVDPTATLTVQDVLELLCDVRADQISYEGECELLAEADNVKEALDLLCDRPTGGGCRVSVGTHGEFPTIEAAIKALLKRHGRGTTVFNLCLLPGEHDLPPQSFFDVIRKRLNGQFSLLLCGAGMESTFLIVREPAQLEMHAFRLQNLTIVGGEAGVYLTLSCENINFQHTHIDALIRDDKRAALILDAREQVRVADCIIMAQDAHFFDIPRKVFNQGGGELGILAELFAEDVVIARTVFMRQALEQSTFLVQPDQVAMRGTMAKALVAEIKKHDLTAEETESYTRLIASLGVSVRRVELFARRLVGDLDRIRFAAASAAAGRDPAVAVMIPSARADCLFDHNEILGQFSIYGMPQEQAPGPEDIQEMHMKLIPLIQAGEIRFKPTQRRLQLRNNRLTRLLVAESVIKELGEYAGSGHGILDGVFETLFLSDNVLLAADNCFVARGHSFTATRFDHEPEDNAEESAGIVIGDNAIYVGTVARAESVDPGEDTIYANIKLYDTTRNPWALRPTESATFRLQIVRDIPQ